MIGSLIHSLQVPVVSSGDSSQNGKHPRLLSARYILALFHWILTWKGLISGFFKWGMQFHDLKFSSMSSTTVYWRSICTSLYLLFILQCPTPPQLQPHLFYLYGHRSLHTIFIFNWLWFFFNLNFLHLFFSLPMRYIDWKPALHATNMLQLVAYFWHILLVMWSSLCRCCLPYHQSSSLIVT